MKNALGHEMTNSMILEMYEHKKDFYLRCLSGKVSDVVVTPEIKKIIDDWLGWYEKIFPVLKSRVITEAKV